MFNRDDYILTINENGDEVMVHKSNFTKKSEPIHVPGLPPIIKVDNILILESEVKAIEPRVEEAPTITKHNIDCTTEYGRWLASAIERGNLGIITSYEADKLLDKGQAVKIPEALKRLGFKTRETLQRVLARGKIKCWFLRELTDFGGAYVSTESIREYMKSEEYSKTISRAATNFMNAKKDVPKEPERSTPTPIAEAQRVVRRTPGQPLRLNRLSQLEEFKGNFK